MLSACLLLTSKCNSSAVNLEKSFPFCSLSLSLSLQPVLQCSSSGQLAVFIFRGVNLKHTAVSLYPHLNVLRDCRLASV